MIQLDIHRTYFAGDESFLQGLIDSADNLKGLKIMGIFYPGLTKCAKTLRTFKLVSTIPNDDDVRRDNR